MKTNLLLLLVITIISSCKNTSNMEQISSFKVIGIAIETTNKNGQSGQDMGVIWGRFFSEEIGRKIPNKINDDIYAIYTNFETDYTGKHTAIIGYKVSSLADIPNGLTGISMQGGTYQKMVAKGMMPDAVITMWKEIWEKGETLNRSYQADFEIHGAKSQNGANSEVDIFIGVQ